MNEKLKEIKAWHDELENTFHQIEKNENYSWPMFATKEFVRELHIHRSELISMVERLLGQNRIQSEFLSSRQCPDHSGKWERGRCLQCEIEELQERNKRESDIAKGYARVAELEGLARNYNESRDGEKLVVERLLDRAVEAETRVAELEEQLADKFKTFEEWKASAIECKELADSVVVSILETQVAELEAKLNPLLWTREMDKAWHTNIPDLLKAFESLRNSKPAIKGES